MAGRRATPHRPPGLGGDDGTAHDALLFRCRELRGRHVTSAEEVLLYVDIHGVSLVDARTRTCDQRVGFNDMTSWCATSSDAFQLKCFGRSGKLEERRFATEPDAALDLQLALESRVQLYVHHPFDVKRMQAAAASFREGDVVSSRILARAASLDDTARWSRRGNAETRDQPHPTSDARPNPSKHPSNLSTTTRPGTANRALDTPGGRLARAGFRRATPARENPPKIPSVSRRGTEPTGRFSRSPSPSSSRSRSHSSSSSRSPSRSPSPRRSRRVVTSVARRDKAVTVFDGVRLDEPGLRAAYLRREAARRAAFEARWAETAAAAEAAAAAAAEAARPPLEPTPPRSDSRRSRGFRARERGRERARAADREAEKAATPPPNLFEGVLRQPKFADGRAAAAAAAADETDLADDYFYDDDDDDDEDREKTKTDDANGDVSFGIRSDDHSDADDDAYPDFVPVDVDPADVSTSSRCPTTPSARRGGGRGGTPDRHRPDASTARLNRRVRALAGIMRDSLGRAGRAASEADVRSECVALADRLRRFVAEGEGADEDG